MTKYCECCHTPNRDRARFCRGCAGRSQAFASSRPPLRPLSQCWRRCPLAVPWRRCPRFPRYSQWNASSIVTQAGARSARPSGKTSSIPMHGTWPRFPARTDFSVALLLAFVLVMSGACCPVLGSRCQPQPCIGAHGVGTGPAYAIQMSNATLRHPRTNTLSLLASTVQIGHRHDTERFDAGIAAHRPR